MSGAKKLADFDLMSVDEVVEELAGDFAQI